jgi:hypothetical protein
MSDASAIYLKDLIRATAALPDVKVEDIAKALGLCAPTDSTDGALDITGVPHLGSPSIGTDDRVHTATMGHDAETDLPDGFPANVSNELVAIIAPSDPRRQRVSKTRGHRGQLTLKVAPMPLTLPPLIEKRYAAGIVSALVSAPDNDGPIDVEALVDTLSMGRKIETLPRRELWRIRGRTQVVVDRRGGFAYFARDQQQLVGDIRRIVGTERTRILELEDLPHQNIFYDAETGERAALDPKGGVILLISDLGIAEKEPRRGAIFESWRAFGRHITAIGGRVVAMAPYPKTRWPQCMRDIKMVYWSGKTSAGFVKRRVQL